MELQQRKPNRIEDYDYSLNGAYFVTICAQDRKKILSDIVGDGFPVPKPIGVVAEEMIRQIPNKYPTVAIDKYVIMPDHIHLLLRCCPQGNVGAAFRRPRDGKPVSYSVICGHGACGSVTSAEPRHIDTLDFWKHKRWSKVFTLLHCVFNRWYK